jgi:hypothetical protein
LQSFFGEIGDVRHGLGFIPVRALDRKWRLTGQSKKKENPNQIELSSFAKI